MGKIIYISGVDGAGKTSVSKGVLDVLSANNIKVRYTWATLRPILLRPIIVIAKFLFVRKHNKFKNYSLHKEHKQRSIKLFKFLMPIQFFVAFIDYYPQYLFKVYFPSKFNNIIIADRYYVDFFIENGMLASWSPEKTFEKISKYQKIFIKPTNSIYLKISSETSMSRKDDIPSIQYLDERMEYYDYIHLKLDSSIINAENRIEEIVQEIKNML